MDAEQAKELLSLHSARNRDTSQPKWKNGFLGSLRPFRGTLLEENFTDVMECLAALSSELSAPTVERAVISDIIGITYFTRAWAGPHGMLGRNELLTTEHQKQLATWVEIIESCFMYLLEEGEEEAFTDYEEYLKKMQQGEV